MRLGWKSLIAACSVSWGIASATAQTPELLHDINTRAFPDQLLPEHLFTTTSAVYFTGRDAPNGVEVRRFAPGDGIRVLRDVKPGPESLETRLFFTAAGDG